MGLEARATQRGTRREAGARLSRQDEARTARSAVVRVARAMARRDLASGYVDHDRAKRRGRS